MRRYTVSDNFNKGQKESPFGDAEIMRERHIFSVDTITAYEGTYMTLGGNLVDESLVPEELFIPADGVAKWEYEKGAKKIERMSKEGFKYIFSEGGMAFPDSLDKPSRNHYRRRWCFRFTFQACCSYPFRTLSQIDTFRIRTAQHVP